MTKSTGVGRGRKTGVPNVKKNDPKQTKLSFFLDQTTTTASDVDNEISNNGCTIRSISQTVYTQDQNSTVNEPERTTNYRRFELEQEEDALTMERHGLLVSKNALSLDDREQSIVNDSEFECSLDDEKISENDSFDEFNETADLENGGFIDTYLGQIQDELKKRKKDGKGPKCYEDGTFWYARMMPSFALSKLQTLSPEALYVPRVFLWLPHYLTDKRLNCPECGSTLNLDGYTDRPKARRVVDMNDSFYIMTCNYRCSNTTVYDPVTKKIKQHAFKGYNVDIVKQLSRSVQMDFPAIFTHRAAISKGLMDLIRPLIKNSAGPTRISKILRELHTLKYDALHLQYLDEAITRQKNPSVASQLTQKKVSVKIFSSFSDKSKYAGQVPSPGYIKYVYTSILHELKPFMDKQMNVLSADILKGDHSFKLPKKIGKINAAPAFNVLYTACNEFEEICMMYITATKALTHLESPFEQYYKSRAEFGNTPPTTFFTDNPTGDRAFLERTLPSLKVTTKVSNTTANSEQTQLPELELPEGVKVYTYSSTSDINSICRLILSDVLINEKGIAKPVYIGFDTEWPVNMQRGSMLSYLAILLIINSN